MTLSPGLPTTAKRSGGRRVGLLALALTLLSGFALTAPVLPHAAADTAPASGVPATVSSDPLPTVQIDGVVWSQAIVGTKVFAGGSWQTVRPAGAAAGTSTVTQANLVSYDLTTGVRDASFSPVVDGQVRAVAASPDGKTIYVGGDFGHVNTKLRNKLAAFDAATGALLPWAPGADAAVQSIAVTPTSVYVGGIFKAIAVPIGTTGVPRTSVAALDPVSGAVQSFAPAVTGTQTAAVKAIAISPDRTKVMIGGQFDRVNGYGTLGSGNGGYGLALLDASTAASLPLQANQTRVRNAMNNSAINALASTPDGVYGVGQAYGTPPSGTLEGTFKADWNGNLVWIEDCHGDSYSVYGTSDAVYVAGHPHYCGNIGGFEETATRSYHRGLAFSTNAQVTIGKETGIYNNFYGVAAPHWLAWFPDFNTGTATGQSQGPWNVTGSGDYVVYGGEFTKVNETAQQGLVRFAKSSIAPDTDGPRVSGSSFVPVAQNFAQGVRLRWPANYDRDNELLTYKLIRNGNTASPVYTTQQASTFWQRPTMAFLDTSTVVGTTYTYRLQVTDPFGNTVTGSDVSVTAAAGASLSSYDQRVLADGPQSYWRLAEKTTSTGVTDTAGVLGQATRQSGVTNGVAGAISGDTGTAYRFPGSSSGFVATDNVSTGPQSFSTEAWFRSTSTSGGLILSFGNAKTGSSTVTDRQLYLSPTGQVVFGTNPNTPKVVSSAAGKNDGAWHHVVGTVDITGLRLYLDGALVGTQGGSVAQGGGVQPQRYNGYWRIGGDAVSGWPNNPTTGYLAGDIDNPAVYDRVLTAAQVKTHYTTGKGTAANVAPTASFTAASTGLSATLDASSSSDTDGTIAGYAWTFGDGTTGTGVNPTHTYATAGSYTVGLTVTDNSGATGSTSKAVSVTAPAAGNFVADTFDRTVASGFGSAPTGGAWTATTSRTSVSGGAGVLALPAAGGSADAYLGSTLRTSADVTTTMTLDKLADGGGTYLTTYGRRVSSTADYRARVLVKSTGAASIYVGALQGSSTVVSLSSSVVAAGTVTPGSQIHVRTQVSGTSPTTVRAKLWLGSAAEPSAWTVTGTADSYAGLQTPGSVGVNAYLSGSATNAPVAVSLQDITAAPVG
ncbi:PKD domain-containing protein [uncultured Friedmanniella sp.]|uniref:PKD domain-containing protein n=1 Tax=uncultured Friedmanniella sp. TaxID=335381 RepID=UPI0035C9F245